MSASPLRTVRPVVVPVQFFVWGILVPGLIAIVIAFIVSGITEEDRRFTQRWNQNAPADMRKSDAGDFPWPVAAFFIVFAPLAGIAAIKLLVEPRYTEYRVLPDRVEYFEGFFNRTQRTVIFDQVIDVRLDEGVLQQTAQAGTVTLVTQQLVSGGDGKLSNREFALRNVPEPKEVYDLIRSLAVKKGPDTPGPAPAAEEGKSS